MDTKALEKFCPWARNELISAVKLRCLRYALDNKGRAAHAADADVVNGAVLTAAEKIQRAALFARIEASGFDEFCEQEAFSWFNRFAAIRYFELHGFLASGIRMLSGTNGSFEPACLRMATELNLPGLDMAEVLSLVSAGNDEALFRRVIVAQMNELAASLPTVFGRVDSADALTLPDNLLGTGEHDVLYHLVTDIPEQAWDDVEVLGWMYQFYNSERKDEFFKSKRKATARDLAPATQLFTPDWIVRYMVENSLGHLWMLNNPTSGLRAQMDYFIEPDEQHEDFIRVSGPEDITFCDPACGSGHILVYAFKLLFAMYEERGYREREIPELILTKNVAGFEIDERAAQIASLALACCAREHDRKFFERGVVADVQVLSSVNVAEAELPTELTETLAHLGEIGSLFAPVEKDLRALDTALGKISASNLLTANTREKLEAALAACKTLSRRFDVVVANPPYMGSSSFNPFMSKWMKKYYPDSCKDLCTAFIERGYSLASHYGYAAMVTMQSWMFLGSFEKMRNRIIDDKTIITMAHLGTRAFDAIAGEVVSVTADVLYNGKAECNGTYFRLVDTIGSEPKRKKYLEAIQNPNCGWFYRADATTFHDIPGSPIAYWASEAAVSAFNSFIPLGKRLTTREGMATADNDRFVRDWWEVSSRSIYPDCPNADAARKSKQTWYPYQKGGDYRKWFGNNELIVNWKNDGEEIKNNIDVATGRIRSHNYNGMYAFREGVTWSSLSSGTIHLRYSPIGSLFDSKGAKGFGHSTSDCLYALALVNSSPAGAFLSFLAPTLDFKVGDVIEIPDPKTDENEAISLAQANIAISRADWNSQETSWEFKHSPLI